jgi:HD-GYP domain-containing protein (c-di-GMP phosphodiesterase class II)
MSPAPRAHLADELLRRFAATIRSAQLYARGHPIIARNLESLVTVVQTLHATQPSIVLGMVGDEIILDEVPVAKSESLSGLIRRLKQIGIERVTIERGATAEEVASFVQAVTDFEAPAAGSEPRALPALPHIRVGRVTVEDRLDASSADMATFRRLYKDAVSVAETIWDSAATEGQPDATAAREMIEGLAQAVSQNRTALLALTTLKAYDNYTYTHMVNVSILTMGQAQGLRIDGPVLRDFGLAALMHDIGKVRMPLDVLNKPGKFTDAEFAIMKRHPVDGAEILRGAADIPPLAPIIAFEHHLRLDGTGYPEAIKRPTLNLGTMLCSIADVYDAMRSQRRYQEAFPSDRILEVLRKNDGQHFDRHLVRRFAQLIGIYPVGNLVRLSTGVMAVVTKIYAPDPHRPQVKVLTNRDGERITYPSEINLWESDEDGKPITIVAPIDPAQVGIDPLTLI